MKAGGTPGREWRVDDGPRSLLNKPGIYVTIRTMTHRQTKTHIRVTVLDDTSVGLTIGINAPRKVRKEDEARQILKWYGACEDDLNFLNRELRDRGVAEIVLTRSYFRQTPAP